ncbi:MAG: TIR domain-containing protein, partial [Acidobacteria bacterium]|nr:TIR domain-containing protein [Acidobacteriota bacterium]
MKVFFSWSGERSHSLAKAFREWLPNVIQAVDPWMSTADIVAGARWQSEIALQLQEARVGIIFLTPENVSSPWLLYEVGALSRALETAYVCPYLFGFSLSELRGPLIQFQAVNGDKNGTFSLVRTLNRAMGQGSIEERRLEQTFVRWWPDLESRFQEIQQIPIKTDSAETKRPDVQEHLEATLRESQPKEVVDLLQAVLRKLSGPEPQDSPAPAPLQDRDRVFIVHGHNEAIKEAVARFIEKLGPAVIILHEQPNEGRTI